MHKDWYQMTPDERLNVLRQRTAIGDSITLIALRYSTSRGAISGALARAGITTGRPQGRNLETGSSKPKPRPKSTFNDFERNPAKKKALEAKNEKKREAENAKDEQQRVSSLPAWLPVTEQPPRALADLHATRECTWPLWPNGKLAEDLKTRLPEEDPKVYCGGPCIDRDRAYCKVHLRMAYKVLPVLKMPLNGGTHGSETTPADRPEPAERAERRETA